MKKKKRAFTITELLVVVVVMGVLAAVTLPKFGKMLETQKTAEAESVMRAVRTEQERRCALEKPYLADFNGFADMLSSNATNHYSYSLTSTGIIARSNGNMSYDLKILSYDDGRICCEGDDCQQLNKDYPACSSFPTPDRDDPCAAEIEPAEPEDPLAYIPCTGSSVQSCGCKGAGLQTRVCNTSTGAWSDWGDCNVPEACSCEGEAVRACDCYGNVGDAIDYSVVAVPNVGTQTRVCDTKTGEWGEWSACNAEPCNSCEPTIEKRSCGCKDAGVQTRKCESPLVICGGNGTTPVCSEWSECSVEECEGSCKWLDTGHAEAHYGTMEGDCSTCEALKNGAACGVCGPENIGGTCLDYVTGCDLECKIGDEFVDIERCKEDPSATMLCVITKHVPATCSCE